MTKCKTKSTNFNQFLLIILILLTISTLIIIPSLAMEYFLQGILIWATKVLPSLLPFFILTKILSYTDFIPTIGKCLSPITRKLYGVGGVSGYVYIMSIISGYPVGAKITSELFSNKIINSSQAYTITSFTSTSGPLFILGTVAIGLFNNSKIGLIVLLSHYLGAMLNGLIYRQKKSITIQIQNQTNSTNILNESMTSSILSIMTVGGFIAIFYMILNLMLHINIFAPITNILSPIGVPSNISTSILAGIIEVTSGCIMLSNCVNNFYIISPILSFLISFGGLSIHAQAFCFLKTFGMKYSQFLLQKTTHAIISTLITLLLILI